MKIKLIVCPPFPANLPSIGLTQLQAMLMQERFETPIEVEIEYFNLEFSKFWGGEAYKMFTDYNIPVGFHYPEWFFQKVAFPELEDNQDTFLNFDGLSFGLNRHDRDAAVSRKIALANLLLLKRPQLASYIDNLLITKKVHEADVVGFSSMFNQNIPVLAYAKRLKALNPNGLIIMGGSNCETPMGEELVRNFDVIDFVFSGPGLLSLPKFITNLLGGELDELHQIDGVFSRRNLHRVSYSNLSSTKKKQTIQPLGQEVTPDPFLDLDYDEFLNTYFEISKGTFSEPHLFFETSRGCWWGEKSHCTFCGLNPNTIGYQSAGSETAILKINALVNKYGDRVKKFDAADNIMPSSYPESVIAKLSLDHEVGIYYEVKSDLSWAKLQTMVRSGLKYVQPGIESLENSLLKVMKKGVSSTQNIRFLKDGTRLKMHVRWNLLFGFPGESEAPYQLYQREFKNIIHLHPPDMVLPVVFLRYSPYFNFQEQFDLDLVPAEFYQKLYPQVSKKSLQSLAYYFEDQNSDSKYVSFKREWYPRLNNWVEDWNRRWFQDDGKLAPDLHLSGSGNEVVDTRSGELITHFLTSSQLYLLEAIDHPTNLGKLMKAIPMADEQSVRGDLDQLIHKGLVFHDNMKSFISLVFKEPSRSAYEPERISYY